MKFLTQSSLSCLTLSCLLIGAGTSSVHAQDMAINPYPSASETAPQQATNDPDGAFQPDQAVIMELLARQAERKRLAGDKPVSLSAAPSPSPAPSAKTSAPAPRYVAQDRIVAPTQNEQKASAPQPLKPSARTYQPNQAVADNVQHPETVKQQLQRGKVAMKPMPEPQPDPEFAPAAKASILEEDKKKQHYGRLTRKTIPITEWGQENIERGKVVSREDTQPTLQTTYETNVIVPESQKDILERIEPTRFKQPQWGPVSALPNKRTASKAQNPVAVEPVQAKPVDTPAPQYVAKGGRAPLHKQIKQHLQPSETQYQEQTLRPLNQQNAAVAKPAPEKVVMKPVEVAQETPQKVSPPVAETPKEPEALAPAPETVAAVSRQRVVPTREPSVQPAMAAPAPQVATKAPVAIEPDVEKMQAARDGMTLMEMASEDVVIDTDTGSILSMSDEPTFAPVEVESELKEVAAINAPKSKPAVVKVQQDNMRDIAAEVASLDQASDTIPAMMQEQALKRGLQRQAGAIVPEVTRPEVQRNAVSELARKINEESEMLAQKQEQIIAKQQKREEDYVMPVQEAVAVQDMAAPAQAQAQAQAQSAPMGVVAMDLPHSVPGSLAANAGAGMRDLGDGTFISEENLGEVSEQFVDMTNVVLPKEATPRWAAEKGQSAYKILSQWSRNAGVDLIWNSQFLVDLQNDVAVNGSYEEAVQEILSQYKGRSAGVHGSLFVDSVSGKKTLVIETNRS